MRMRHVRFGRQWRRGCLAAVLALAGLHAHAAEPQRIELGTADTTPLHAWWWAPERSADAPVVIALHGCGGLTNERGVLAERYLDYGRRLYRAGYAVLMPDSFGSRGQGSQCAVRYKNRSIDLGHRRSDVLRALAWLEAAHGIGAARVALLGWSNGATTTLAVLDNARGTPPPVAGAAVFYPGCGTLQRQQAMLAAVPLLMELGADDDWTPPAPCIALAERLKGQGRDVTLHVYPDSVHGFDGTAPVRVRTDVPNGVSPHGVRQGGNPAAREASLAALDAFLARVLARKGQ